MSGAEGAMDAAGMAVEYDSSAAHGKTSEHAFEDDVERLMRAAGWRTFASNIEAAADYDRTLALKTGSLVGFVRETQPEEWAKVEGLYGAHAEERFLARVAGELEPHGERGGLVNVLRHGIKMAPGATFRLCWFKPSTRASSTTCWRTTPASRATSSS